MATATKSRSSGRAKPRARSTRKKTAIHILLDRSGSMSSRRDNTIEGFNSFVQDQREQDGDVTLSLVQFDDRYEPNFLELNLAQVAQLDQESYVPRGMTALYDAIGKSVGDFEDELEKRKTKPDQVLFVIITDGIENASHELNQGAVKQLLEAKHGDGWQFVYLGTNQDAITTAQGFGGQAVMRSSADYGDSPVQTSAMWSTLSSATSRYRGQSVAQVDSYFSDADRKTMTGDVWETDEGSGTLEPKEK